MTEDGYLITNNHVVDGGSAYKVTIAGNTYDAELVGTDPSSDVAVLKAKDASGLTPMEIGDSDNLTVGEWVMTLGAPFGLEQSVATASCPPRAARRSWTRASRCSPAAAARPLSIRT